MDFLYTVDLPFSGITLIFRELNSKEQLALAKINIILPANDDNILDYSSVLRRIILGCVENKKDFSKINLLDYILFITKLRIISIGDELELYIKKTDSEESSKITINLNLFMKNLYEVGTEILRNNTLLYKDIEVVLDFPSIESEKILIDRSNMNHIEHILITIPEYIKFIKIKDNYIDIKNFASKEKMEIYEKLPVSLRTEIQMKVLNFINKLAEKDILGLPNIDIIKFNFYNNSHQQLARFFFSNDLRSIYRDYYILASKKIDPSFINGLSISERRVFMSFVEEEIKAREENTSSSIPISKNSTSLEDLMDEFGG
jgi:hypothetical protein